jgi:hypothetical protein
MSSWMSRHPPSRRHGADDRLESALVTGVTTRSPAHGSARAPA